MFGKFISLLADAGRVAEKLPVEIQNMEEDISSWSVHVVITSSLVLLALGGLAIATKGRGEKLKMPLFITMSLVIVSSTLMLAASIIHLNTVSDSGGPVHWRAGIEYWVCDNEIELIDPRSFSSKSKSNSTHLQADKQWRVEGVVVDNEIDASLGQYLSTVGGELTNTTLVIPVSSEGSIFVKETDGDGPSNPYPNAANNLLTIKNGIRYISASNGQLCNNKPAEVQVFVYRFNEADGTYEQTKLEKPASFILSPESTVPPGDCVIVEFGPSKTKTDKLCKSYGVRDKARCAEFGVEARRAELCNIEQLNYSPIGSGNDPNIDRRASEPANSSGADHAQEGSSQ